MRDKPASLEGPIPWIRIEDFRGKYISGSASNQGVSEATIREYNLKVFPTGTVLCTCSCTMGATAIVARPLVGNQTFIGIVPGPELVADYVFYLVQAAASELTARATGAIQQYLAKNDFSRLRIPRPPKRLQDRIADFLDRKTAVIDELIAKKERLVGLLAEKRQALITQAVTKGLDPTVPMKDSGVEWIGRVPAHWNAIAMRRVISGIEQGWSPESHDRTAEGDEWAVLKLGAVFRGVFRPGEHKALPESTQPERRYEVRQGDVLLTRANTLQLVGDACFVEQTPQRLMLPDLIYRLRLRHDIVDPRFLVKVLISDCGRNQIIADARGSSMTMAKVSGGHIRSWLVPLPPSVEEQRAIATFIQENQARIDATADVVKRQIEKLREYRQALITAAVTGKIDVSPGAGA
jgi:type I restriction enzyme S subunit